MARWPGRTSELDHSQCRRSDRRRSTLDGHRGEGNQGVIGQRHAEAATTLPRADEHGRQATSRSHCYGLLSLVFRDTPNADIVTELRAPSLTDVLGQLGCDVTQDLAGDLVTVTRKLAEAYTRLFIGPGSHVSLYASVHHPEEGQLWGDSTVRLKRFVEATGLSFEGKWEGIPDHIAVEFELMQRLANYEADSWQQSERVDGCNTEDVRRRLGQCLEVEDMFLRDHLNQWVPQFCDRVVEMSSDGFYGNIARLTKSVVASDGEQLTAIRDALKCELQTEESE